ncbi:MAG TPA: FtsX-like permease family protein [Gemmatimonadales bacterium]|nr:FtsX-like permease family protein [Gemmatimonadales bacterium]
MKIVSIIFRNAFRHPLRSILTVFGIATAVMAFGLLRTIVGAWNAGVANSSENRMIVRHRVSFIFPLPQADRAEILRVPGVSQATWANWFGGVYGDANDFRNFWPRFAVDPDTWFHVYPEFLLAPDQLTAFQQDRSGAIIGRKLAAEHNFKIGDVITLNGDIFPGTWQFTVRGIYTGKEPSTDETQMFFQWNYLYENVKQREPGREVGAGWYVLSVDRPDDMAKVATLVDTMYTNSAAPTKTESERAFQQGFVAMSSAIITSLEVISFVIVGIILLVLANTIVMAVRERTREYAVLKTLGFTGRHVLAFILGEALVIGILGGVLGIVLTFPVVFLFGKALPTFFPVIGVAPITIVMALLAAAICGLAAGVAPALRAAKMPIVAGLRTVG